jgi:hypothetical protein
MRADSSNTSSSKSFNIYRYLNMIDFDVDKAKTILKNQLDRTYTKCEAISHGVENQERFICVAEVPRVTENRRKAEYAYKNIQTSLDKVKTPNELVEYFSDELAYKEGLFFRMFRGRANKHLLDKEESLKSMKFKK